MTTDPSTEWITALQSATGAIRASDPTDLRALRSGVGLALDATSAAVGADIWAALRWIAISELVCAVADDLHRIPGPDLVAVPAVPDPPMPDAGASYVALQDLWAAIHDGLRGFMIASDDHTSVFCAAITARSALRLIEAGAQP